MGATEVAGANAGLNIRAVTIATSTLVELVNRSHINVFQEDRLIPSGIDLYITLILASDSFVCNSAAPAASATHQNYKMAIQRVDLIIFTTQLTSTA